MRRVLFAISCISQVVAITLFHAERPISSDLVDVRMVGRSKRDSNSGTMAKHYDISLAVNGEHINARLTRKDADERLMANVEGYMLYKSAPYLIQRHEETEGHVMHRVGDKLPRSTDSHTSKYKRDGTLLDRDLTVTIEVYFDEAAKAYIKDRNPEIQTNKFLNKFYAMTILYIDRMLGSLKKWGTTISCRGGGRYGFQFSKEEMEVLTNGQSLDKTRQAVCANLSREWFAKKINRWPTSDFSLLITGLGAAHDGQKGVKLAEPCEATDRYIMAPSFLSVYKGEHKENRWSFSRCSRNMMVKYLKKIESDTSKSCLLFNRMAKGKALPRYLLPPLEQCRLVLGAMAGYRPPTPNSNDVICASGLSCSIPDDDKSVKVVQVIPFPGTPCGNNMRKGCYFGKCIDHPK